MENKELTKKDIIDFLAKLVVISLVVMHGEEMLLSNLILGVIITIILILWLLNPFVEI